MNRLSASSNSIVATTCRYSGASVVVLTAMSNVVVDVVEVVTVVVEELDVVVVIPDESTSSRSAANI